jgi:hypothetical protein
VHRFLGLSLSGGKSDKACLAVIEFYPHQKRVFLARLFEKIKTEEHLSADLKIVQLIQQFEEDSETLTIDVPLSLPKCLRCQLKCPGYENCSESEMIFFRGLMAEVNRSKKPKKVFTPYTQRCTDAYLNYKMEEKIDVQHAMGSNLAPLTARALFLKRRLKLDTLETNTKVAVFRLGEQLKVSKSHSKFHKHSVGGDESRQVILRELIDSRGVFIYQQDLKSMVENNHAFEAFICAYMGFLKKQHLTEERPAKFPKEESWVEIPKVSRSV